MMRKRKYRTKEERQTLIEDFRSSGKTKVAWCEEMNIPLSTLTGWIKGINSEKETVKFFPLNPKNKSKNADDIATTNLEPTLPSIMLEIGSCKVHIKENTSMPFLSEVLKVVKSSDV